MATDDEVTDNFEHVEKVEWVMNTVLRGVKDAYAASLYIFSVLLQYTNV